jgi:hypothetical protein
MRKGGKKVKYAYTLKDVYIYMCVCLYNVYICTYVHKGCKKAGRQKGRKEGRKAG